MSAGRRGEQRIYGQHACRAVFSQRPDDVLRVYVGEAMVRPFGDLLRACAERRLPYKLVPSEELEAITESKHHEGICVVARPRPAARLEALIAPSGPATILALTEVGNPHNLGAILRTAAHFGARGVLVGGSGSAGVSGAAFRTAQGGAEHLALVRVSELAAALTACQRAGFAVCATSSHEGSDPFTQTLPARVVLLLGSEGQGVPRELMTKADLTWQIPGTGAVESLNIAAAAAVLLGEIWRQRPSRPAS
jgi:TrmH RNA methyltransferase